MVRKRQIPGLCHANLTNISDNLSWLQQNVKLVGRWRWSLRVLTQGTSVEIFPIAPADFVCSASSDSESFAVLDPNGCAGAVYQDGKAGLYVFIRARFACTENTSN